MINDKKNLFFLFEEVEYLDWICLQTIANPFFHSYILMKELKICYIQNTFSLKTHADSKFHWIVIVLLFFLTTSTPLIPYMWKNAYYPMEKYSSKKNKKRKNSFNFSSGTNSVCVCIFSTLYIQFCDCFCYYFFLYFGADIRKKNCLTKFLIKLYLFRFVKFTLNLLFYQRKTNNSFPLNNLNTKKKCK